MSLNEQYPPPPPQQPYPFPAAEAPAATGTNGLSIAGFILAFVAAPLGLVFSIIGLVQAGKRNQKGKGLAIAGIIVAVIVMAIGGVVAATVGSKVATLADPGCSLAKDAVNSNQDKVSNPDTVVAALQDMIAGLNKAADASTNDDVKASIQALSDDYGKLLTGAQSGNIDDSLTTKATADEDAFNKLCSLDLGQN